MGCLRGLLILVLVAILGGIAVNVFNGNVANRERSVAAAPARVATIDKSEQMQADRLTLIRKLQAEGVFQKIEVPGSLPRLYVRPAFYQLDFDLKEKFVGVVYAYYFDGSNDIDTVRIFDSRTDKEVGSYAAVQGGLKLN